MLQTPDDRTIASKLAVVTAHTRSSRYARLNPKITKATLTARSADRARQLLMPFFTEGDAAGWL
jgi:hypothetical protein